MAIKHLFQFFVLLGVTAGYLLIVPPLSAAPAKNPQKTLQNVRQEIHSLQKEISQQESARQRAKGTILNTERALQKTRVAINALLKQKTISQQKLGSLYKDLQAIQQQIKSMQSHIALVLQKQYLHHRKHNSTKLLTAQEISQQKRDQIYYQYITQAQNKLIKQMQSQQGQLKTLSSNVESELRKLDAVTRRKNHETKQLETKKITSRIQEQQFAKNIQTKKQRLAQLLADEKRMTALVVQLQQKINTQSASQKTQPSNTPSKGQPATRITSAADASVSGQKFQLLKGKMKLPMIGTFTGRFGGARSTEGANWTGVFISAPASQDVRAIADGKIVYAGYLKGFGKISIVDHGGQYLSVYAGLSSINLSAGHQVKAGDKLGKSGSLDSGETGLYFQIRHMGQPVNPMHWTVL